MKHHFTLSCLAVFTGLLACSSGEESPGPTAGAPSGGQAGGGSASGGSSAGSGTGGATPTAGSSTGGMAGGSAGGGQSGAGGSGGSGGAAGGGGSGGGATGGEALYTAKCAACHGAQGVGGPLGPEIQHPVRDYSTWVVRNGRAMTTFPAPMLAVPSSDLSDDALASIWAYLDEPAQPTTGQALYHDYCANCHGADAKGGPTQRNILNELGELDQKVRGGAHPGEFDMRREYMPAFNTTRIDDAELDAIRDYLESL